MEHQIQVRVRYSETDQMGVVYHGSYIPYFEMGRVEWLRAKGWSEQNELLTTAYFILVFVDMKTGRPMVPPDYLKAVMNL